MTVTPNVPHAPAATPAPVFKSRIQKRMLKILADGEFHHLKELHGCLYEPDAADNNVHFHVWAIRRKLRAVGQDIQTASDKAGTFYRHVKILHIVTGEPAAPTN